MKKHKHAFVGADLEGDACIYVVYIDEDGTTGEYLPAELLQKIADKINSGRIGLCRRLSGAARRDSKGWAGGAVMMPRTFAYGTTQTLAIKECPGWWSIETPDGFVCFSSPDLRLARAYWVVADNWPKATEREIHFLLREYMQTLAVRVIEVAA